MAAYYRWPEFQQFCSGLSLYKSQKGWIFAALGAVVANGIVPELLKLLFGEAEKTSAKQLLHQCGLFACLGVLVDKFYVLQSVLFGSSKSAPTLLVKILFDQFVYTLLFALPLVVLSYAWMENGYRLGPTLRTLNLRLIWRRVLPLFFGNCCFWIPALVAIYSLPTELQFLLALILGSAWSLILIHLARRSTQKA